MPGHIISQDSRLLKEGPAANRTCPILEINGVLDDSEMPRQPSDKGRDKLNQVRTMR